MAVSRAQEFSGPDLQLDEYYLIRIHSANDAGENKYQPGVPRVLLVLQLLDDAGKVQRDEEGKPIEILQGLNVKATAGKRALLHQFWNACIHAGKGVPDGEDMDTDELIGKRARVLWGMVQNSFDGTERPGIVKVSALRQSAAVAAPVIRSSVPNEDADDLNAAIAAI